MKPQKLEHHPSVFRKNMGLKSEGRIKQEGREQGTTFKRMTWPLVPVIMNLPANEGDMGSIRKIELGQEDPLEEGMATHSSILAWKIP